MRPGDVVQPGEPVTLPDSGTSVTYVQMPDELCEAYLKANPSGDCIEEVITTVTTEQVRTPISMAATTNAGAVHCKTWKQIRQPTGSPKIWQFGHDGKFCYDNSVAWYNTYRGTAGYHNCGYNSGFLYSVTIQACKRSGDRTSQVRFNVNGNVAVFVKGFPVHYTFMPYVTGSRYGTVTMFYDYH